MTVYIGIDWSEKKHDISFQNEAGGEILRMQVSHSVNGFLALDQARQRLDVSPEACMVGLETTHTLLIDFLWDQGYSQIYVLPPSQVKSSQGRHRHSGAKDDPHDAALIAEMLRTDRHRLYPWYPGSGLLQQMRAKVGFVSFLTQDILRHSNRLRSVLLRYYPAAMQVFSDLDTGIALAFIQSYPNPQAASRLDFDTFQKFAKEHRYPQPKRLLVKYERLQHPQPLPADATVLAYQTEAVQLCQVLMQLVQAKRHALREMEKLYEQHPDRAIFDSLPGAGIFLSAGLLVKFGEDRQRFPYASLVQALAGTCPITVQSGKSKYVRFRRACDKDFRSIAQQWSRHTLQESCWATAYFQRVRPHCRSDSHAFRCLANRWLAILWKLWQSYTPYDESYHLKQRTNRLRPYS